VTLARETGWSETFILDEIPMSRALRYWHAAIWINGAKTTKNREPEAKKLAQIDAMLSGVVVSSTNDTDF
jgi:hypothetical protein